MSDEASNRTSRSTEVHVRPLNERVGRLVVVDGPNRNAFVGLVLAQATVGRHPTNDLVLDDPRVSSVHLELVRRPAGRVLVRDAGSTNGTWLGDHRIVEVELAAGAMIQVGDSVLRVEADHRVGFASTEKFVPFRGLVGSTPEMRELFQILERVAAASVNLLVLGDSGTGKEEVARAVHAERGCAPDTFIVLDATTVVPAIGDVWLASAFERAAGGTLFIDEVGDLPAQVQSHLVRILQEHDSAPAGSAQIPPARVIAATRRDLRPEIEASRFREDLYLRLARVRVVLPSLRARIDDIAALSERFLAEAAASAEKPVILEEEALTELRRLPFPGNLRELRSTLVRAAALSTGGTIRLVDIAGEGHGFRGSEAERSPLDLAGTFSDAKGRAIERFERAYLETLMRRCEGNLSRAAREADLARHHLRELLKRRGLYRDGGDSGSGGSSDPTLP
ncbi:MAG TPA: sigma 54-interacting transcriptional regulator [Polyangiaceae bacterium]|nr:sigma 54-interacting transcriptional regulator [Polyangiaceae bacterium]